MQLESNLSSSGSFSPLSFAFFSFSSASLAEPSPSLLVHLGSWCYSVHSHEEHL